MPQIPIPTCIHTPGGTCAEVIFVETTVTLAVVLQEPLALEEAIEVDIKVYQVEVTANRVETIEITDYTDFFNEFTPAVTMQPGQKRGSFPVNIKADAVTQPTSLLFVASCWEYNSNPDAYVVHTVRVEPEAH